MKKSTLAVLAVVLIVVALGGTYYIKRKSLKAIIPPADKTASWALFQSAPCELELKVPSGWVAGISRAATASTADANVDCLYLKGPDYQGSETGARQGAFMSLTRTLSGSIYNGITINTAADYVKAFKIVTVEGENGGLPVLDKSIGKRKGKLFTFKLGDEALTGYLITKGRYFYLAAWPSPVAEETQEVIDLQLDSIKFSAK